MALQIRRLSEPLGAEITGLNLHSALDEDLKSELRQAFLDHQFIVVPGQELSDFEHMRFCQAFGEIQAERTVPDAESEEIVGMMHVSNFHEEGILPNGEMWFHSDQCYFDTPCKATSLHSIVAPKSGGHTKFANCITAYETLSEQMKRRLDGFVGMNIYDYNSPNMHVLKAEHAQDAPRYAHPLVRSHPETGKKSLYLNRLMTDYILDFDFAEGKALLEELFDHGEREELVYVHPWREGDLTIWDNRCLLHARTDFDASEKRLLRRFAVRGEKPV